MNIPISVSTGIDIDEKIQNSGIVDVGMDTKNIPINVASQTVSLISTTIENQGYINIDIGGSNMTCTRIISKTTAEWAALPTAVSQSGCLYIYLDRKIQSDVVPGIKIGNGSSYIKDLPFIDDKYLAHIFDTSIHTNSEEKNKWDNKLNARASGETLIFYT